MKAPVVLVAAAFVIGGEGVAGRVTDVERVASHVLDVMPPSDRVRGEPGAMRIDARPCRVMPTADTRRRIVEIALQEWAFFGFPVVDQTDLDAARLARQRAEAEAAATGNAQPRRRRSRLTPEEARRVAASIAGYWSVTPEGGWIVARQNEEWRGPDGIAARWNAPWSAAFISWVMCEAGLGTPAQFTRAVAHHAYIDQAIRARDHRAAQAAFVAYDAGEAGIAPGDLLCSSRRPVYRTIADRRRQMGAGARSHCDIVVRIDEAQRRILAIGGNVRGVVGLKVLLAERERGQSLRVVDWDEDGRPIFAHLKLRAEPLQADALTGSPVMRAFVCRADESPLAGSALAAARQLIGAAC